MSFVKILTVGFSRCWVGNNRNDRLTVKEIVPCIEYLVRRHCNKTWQSTPKHLLTYCFKLIFGTSKSSLLSSQTFGFNKSTSLSNLSLVVLMASLVDHLVLLLSTCCSKLGGGSAAEAWYRYYSSINSFNVFSQLRTSLVCTTWRGAGFPRFVAYKSPCQNSLILKA
jgi:hypothetical protein